MGEKLRASGTPGLRLDKKQRGLSGWGQGGDARGTGSVQPGGHSGLCGALGTNATARAHEVREGPEQTQLGRPSVCLMPGFGLGVAEHLGLGLEGLAEPPCPLCATLRLPALPPALSGTRGQNMATAHLRLLQAQPRAVSLTRPKASRRWDLPPSSAAPLSQTGDPSKAWGASPRDLEVSQADVALVPSVKPMSSLIPLFTQPTGCPFCVGLRVWLGTQPQSLELMKPHSWGGGVPGSWLLRHPWCAHVLCHLCRL